MSGRDKDAAMLAFKNGETRILVGTTVIEVGIDVPDATIIVIEHAEPDHRLLFLRQADRCDRVGRDARSGGNPHHVRRADSASQQSTETARRDGGRRSCFTGDRH
jgi:superfamily II DNA/RNA helicase